MRATEAGVTDNGSFRKAQEACLTEANVVYRAATGGPTSATLPADDEEMKTGSLTLEKRPPHPPTQGRVVKAVERCPLATQPRWCETYRLH